MPELAFVMSPRQDWFIGELVETIRYELELQGIPSSLHEEGFPQPRPDLLYALAAPRRYVELEGVAALPDDSILKRTVFIGAEAPGVSLQEEQLALLRRAGAVFEIDVRSVLALRRAGVAARTLRPGYSQLRDNFDPEAERQFDVMFLGANSARRSQLLARYGPLLARHNCLIQLTDPGIPNSAGSSSFLAESKYDLLARTKVVVNLHRDEERYLESLRVIEAMHAGAVVVTEHASGLMPFTAGEHLLVAGEESLPFVVEAVLRDTELQRRLRQQAYERLSSWLPFALSIAVLRAALVELVGHPVAADAQRGRSAVVPLPAWAPWNPAPRQSDIGELQLAPSRQPAGSGQRSTLRLVHETPSWRAVLGSRITVLTALGANASANLATLDSVAANWMQDLELVIAGTGAGEESLRAVERWLGEHPRLPARLVAHDLDLGTGAARNLALEHARAPYCLILDAGGEIYRDALNVMLPTLEAPSDIVFVYCICEVVAGADTGASAATGGDTLINVYGWDPGRFRLGNYIHAPFLIRRDRLRELGGFTDDLRLLGWEDYELWCRIAARGWRGQLMARILARRPPPAATAQFSLVSSEAAIGLALLAEHVPWLLGDLAAV